MHQMMTRILERFDGILANEKKIDPRGDTVTRKIYNVARDGLEQIEYLKGTGSWSVENMMKVEQSGTMDLIDILREEHEPSTFNHAIKLFDHALGRYSLEGEGEPPRNVFSVP